MFTMKLNLFLPRKLFEVTVNDGFFGKIIILKNGTLRRCLASLEDPGGKPEYINIYIEIFKIKKACRE